MIIIVDDYAVSIDKNNNGFRLTHPKGVRQFSCGRVTAIHVIKPCLISTPAILLAAENNIPVLFFDARGKPLARIWETAFGSISIIRQQQLRFSEAPARFQWLVQCIELKLETQATLLHHLKSRITRCREMLELAEAEMRKQLAQLKSTKKISEQSIRTAEAQIGKLYWKALAETMEAYVQFEKRTRRPAQDEFNALINYGYGMLYAVVETAALTAGLDPHIGILHADEYDRPAFVFDAIEPFRAWIDRTVCDMALQSLVEADHFEKKEEGGIWLSKAGKKVFIPLVNGMLAERTLFNHKRIKRKDQIQLWLTEFAQYLLKDFKP